MSSSSGIEPEAALDLDGAPEPSPFTPDQFGAWRGMLRVHATVFRALDRALLADHGFGVDAYGVLITLVTRAGRHAPDRRAGRAAQPQPERGLPVGRPAREDRPRRAAHQPCRRAQPARRTDAPRPRPPSRRTGHPPRGRPRTAARPPRRARPQAARRTMGEGDARLGLKSRLAALKHTQAASPSRQRARVGKPRSNSRLGRGRGSAVRRCRRRRGSRGSPLGRPWWPAQMTSASRSMGSAFSADGVRIDV